MEESISFYRSLCSSETLRSGKSGFFHDFSEHVMQTVGDLWISKVFGKLTTDQDRVRTIFSDDKIRPVVVEILSKVSLIFRDKNGEISRSKRLEAQQLFTTGQLEKSLILFSQAVLRAPPADVCKKVDRGFSLALAFIGRADVFVALREYDNALQDLRSADEQDLPDELKQEIRGKTEACERFLEESKRCIVPRNCGKKNDIFGRRSDPLPEVSSGRNRDLPCASVLLEIEESPRAGKRAVASAEINPGDVLVVEPPLASCVLPEFYGTHCHHCFSRLRAPVGCPSCSSVAFCGRSCKHVALSTYHKFECKILALLIGSGMSALSFVGLRMVTQEGVGRCLKIYDAIRGGTWAEESAADSKLSKSARRRLRKKKLEEWRGGLDSPSDTDRPMDLRAYDLVTHQKQRSSKDFLERTLMAGFLLKCLQRVNFFDDASPDHEALRDEEVAVGSLLLRNLQLLQFNAHEVFETRLGSEHRFRQSRTVYIGVAIYPTVARFNHDCYPAVTRYFVDGKMVIRATRCLRPGEVVAENYGPIFTKRSLLERRRTLEGRYWFRCECTACQEDWPLIQNITSQSVRLRCPSEGCDRLHPRPGGSRKPAKCSSCGKRRDLRERLAELGECEDLYAEGLARMEEEAPEAAIDILAGALKKFSRVAAPPHRETHLAEMALGACMADSGNAWRPRPL